MIVKKTQLNFLVIDLIDKISENRIDSFKDIIKVVKRESTISIQDAQLDVESEQTPLGERKSSKILTSINRRKSSSYLDMTGKKSNKKNKSPLEDIKESNDRHNKIMHNFILFMNYMTGLKKSNSQLNSKCSKFFTLNTDSSFVVNFYISKRLTKFLDLNDFPSRNIAKIYEFNGIILLTDSIIYEDYSPFLDQKMKEIEEYFDVTETNTISFVYNGTDSHEFSYEEIRTDKDLSSSKVCVMKFIDYITKNFNYISKKVIYKHKGLSSSKKLSDHIANSNINAVNVRRYSSKGNLLTNLNPSDSKAKQERKRLSSKQLAYSDKLRSKTKANPNDELIQKLFREKDYIRHWNGVEKKVTFENSSDLIENDYFKKYGQDLRCCDLTRIDNKDGNLSFFVGLNNGVILHVNFLMELIKEINVFHDKEFEGFKSQKDFASINLKTFNSKRVIFIMNNISIYSLSIKDYKIQYIGNHDEISKVLVLNDNFICSLNVYGLLKIWDLRSNKNIKMHKLSNILKKRQVYIEFINNFFIYTDSNHLKVIDLKDGKPCYSIKRPNVAYMSKIKEDLNFLFIMFANLTYQIIRVNFTQNGEFEGITDYSVSLLGIYIDNVCFNVTLLNFFTDNKSNERRLSTGGNNKVVGQEGKVVVNVFSSFIDVHNLFLLAIDMQISMYHFFLAEDKPILTQVVVVKCNETICNWILDDKYIVLFGGNYFTQRASLDLEDLLTMREIEEDKFESDAENSQDENI